MNIATSRINAPCFAPSTANCLEMEVKYAEINSPFDECFIAGSCVELQSNDLSFLITRAG